MHVRLGLVTVLSLLPLLACPIRAQTAAPTAADASSAAKALFIQGRYDDAIASYRQVQSRFPTAAAEAQRMIGVCYQWKTDYTNAAAAYRSLLVEYPESEAAGEALYWLVLCDAAQGNFGQAIVDLANHVRYVTTKARPPLTMPKTVERYQEKRQYAAAPKKLNQVPAAQPQAHAPRSHLLIGIGYQSEGKYAEARAAFKQAVDNGDEPSNAARLKIDDVLREERRYTEELAYLQKLYDEVPELRATSLIRQAYVLSTCLGGVSQANTAIDKLRQVISEFPDDPLAVKAQARIASIQVHNLLDFAVAEPGLRDFMAKYPDYPALIVVAHDLAGCSYLQQNYAAAATLFLDATKLNDVSNWVPTCIYMAADCYMRIGDFTKAKEQADLLISKYPAESWAEMAKINYANLTGEGMPGGVK